MLIWSGYGLVVPAVAFGTALLTQLAVDAAFGPEAYTGNDWPVAGAMVLAGALIFFIGQKLEAREGRVVVDKETGEELTLKDSHSFFFSARARLGLDRSRPGPDQAVRGVLIKVLTGES